MEKTMLKIEVHNVGDGQYETMLYIAGPVTDVLQCTCEAMYKLNEQVDKCISDDMPKNFFWNTIVACVGERMLRESEK